MAKGKPTKVKEQLYPLLSAKERVSIWERARGLWKNRNLNPIDELRKMRKEWERKLP